MSATSAARAVAADTAPIPPRDAVLAWLAGWFGGSLLSALVFQASGHRNLADTPPAWILAAQLALWTPLIAATWYIGSRHGSGDLRRDFALRWRTIDLLGIPLGVVAQLGLLPLLYWPLDHFWPDVFGRDRLERPARDLWSGAQGFGVVLVVLVAAVGAPLVEELVYRGLLQGNLVRCLGRVTGVLLASAWFAAIHFQSAQLPGLLAAGLLFGLCALFTRRLGMAVLCHVAFNATGLALVAG